MTNEEYQNCKKKSNIVVLDYWLKRIQVTPDQDKAFSSGRQEVPTDVELRVNEYFEKMNNASDKLELALNTEMAEYKLEWSNGEKNRIVATKTNNGGLADSVCITFDNKGIDVMGNFVYYMQSSITGHCGVLIYTRYPYRRDNSQKLDEWQWYLWRGNFSEDCGENVYQDYWNRLTAKILFESCRDLNFNFFSDIDSIESGKTFALTALPTFVSMEKSDRLSIGKKFKQLVMNGKIRGITYHSTTSSNLTIYKKE